MEVSEEVPRIPAKISAWIHEAYVCTCMLTAHEMHYMLHTA